MKILACALFVAVAGAGCADDDDDFLIVPGGDPPSVGGSAPGATFEGRVCVVRDLRDLATCADDVGRDLTVTIAGRATTTATDGTFSIPVPITQPGDVVPFFTVTGAGVVPSTVAIDNPFVTTGAIPVVDQTFFNQLQIANGVTATTGTGSILATVSADNMPAVGVSVMATPAPAFGPFYDSTNAEQWGFSATGQRGVVWIPSLTAGTATLDFATDTGVTTNVAGIQVRNGGITILNTAFPTVL